MSASEFHIVTRWRIEATVGEITAVLSNPLALPRWWPAVYLEVKQLKPGGLHNIGAEYELYSKGWLPYTLRWRMRVKAVEPERRSEIEALGDFAGGGVWRFTPNGRHVDVDYDWRIHAAKPWMRRLAVVLAPVFSANHRWAMARGEESLVLEIARRRAATDEARALIPPPPGPTFVKRG